MAQRSVEQGHRIDIVVGQHCTLPPDVFHQILGFLSGVELALSACLVSRAWLAASRSPRLWHTLNQTSGLRYDSSTVTNTSQLVALLKGNPHFKGVKTLVPPESIKMTAKAMETIAEVCPLLENIDLGYSHWSHMKIDNEGLLSLPSLFPNLQGIKTNNYKIDGTGVAGFCAAMGPRLVSLRIDNKFFPNALHLTTPLSDQTLSGVDACSCPNLEEFAYTGPYYRTEKSLSLQTMGSLHFWKDAADFGT